MCETGQQVVANENFPVDSQSELWGIFFITLMTGTQLYLFITAQADAHTS